MMGLRLTEGIDVARFKQQTGQALKDCINQEKRALYLKQGLLSEDSASLKPTLEGRLVLTTLTAELLS
jgi:coproporphyrinogen III oxidase-like Fe-S oxidoreductase